jgi:Fe-S-cluster containining protein
VQELEAELEDARALDVGELADAIETIGFECTRCGACCKSEEDDPHTATVFPDEVREVQAAERDDRADERDRRSGDAASGSRSQSSRDWRDVARPMPYGLDDDGAGETFEWALQTDSCGDCTFYEENESGTGSCSVHGSRPLICQTYPFSVALGGTSQPMGEAVDEAGMVRAHECEGLGRDISREDAESLASALKERAVRELEEAIDVRDSYEPANPEPGETVVHDSEGAKRPDGSAYGE